MKNFKYKYLKYKKKYLKLKELNELKGGRSSLSRSISYSTNEYTYNNRINVCKNMNFIISYDEIKKEINNKEGDLNKFIILVNNDKFKNDLLNFVNFISLLFRSLQNNKIENKNYITSHIYKYIDFFNGFNILQHLIKYKNNDNIYINTYNKFMDKIIEMYETNIKNKNILNSFFKMIINKDKIKQRDEYIKNSFENIYKYINNNFCSFL